MSEQTTTLESPQVKNKILLVEDDTNLGKVLKKYLELNDYEVELARDGKLGLAAFKGGHYDICLLDVMMPNMDGFQLAEEIRNIDPDIPLFFLTAKNMKEDIIKGYQLGADDYIMKPFDSEILLHKIMAIVKRNTEFIAAHDTEEFHIGNYYFNSRRSILQLKGEKEERHLSIKENSLLKLLCETRNDIMLRSEALKKVWGSDSYFNGRSMDVYITKLRKHLKDDPNIEIKTVHGKGFRLMVPDEQVNEA
jgi:DNA-binding response OmpR family regulator